MRAALGAILSSLWACGGTQAAAPTPIPSTRDLALESATIREPDALRISGVTIGPEGRARPFGVSGGEPVANLDGDTIDPTYAYSPENPIRLGGHATGDAELRQSAYLNALFGPQGQPIYYGRIGSCCPLPDYGVLDAFELTYEGLAAPLVIYIDLYHRGPLQVPVGLRGAREDLTQR
jgi:hypothetical protein